MEKYRAARWAFRVVGFVGLIAPYYLAGVDPVPPAIALILAAFVLGPDVVETYLTR